MSSKHQNHHRQERLCAQVAEIASLALGSSRDPRLQQLLVHSVSLASKGARLVIHVRPNQGLDFAAIADLVSALEASRGWMRGQIAEQINRKRIPQVAFELLLVAPEEPS